MSHKEPLSIRLTESVVFLRGSPDAVVGRRRHVVGDAPPAMLRGLLTLHLTKPTRVSSIEITLDGKSTVQWPEGTGHRRVDIPEEKKILSARTVLFSAKTCATSTRSASLGPSTRSLDDESDDPHDSPPTARSSSGLYPRLSIDSTGDAVQPNPSLGIPPYTSRRNSADQYGWQQAAATPDTAATLSTGHPPTPPASPPYTPEPVYSSLFDELPVSRPQTPDPRPEGLSHQNSLRGFRTEENPGQMLEEYRNALRMEMGSTIRPATSRTPSGPSPQSSQSALAESSASGSRPAADRRSESAPSSRSTSRHAEHRDTRRTRVSQSRTASPSASVRSHRSPPEHEHEHGLRSLNTSRWNFSNMFKDVKDKVRNSSPKDGDRRRGRSPERTVVMPHLDWVMGRSEEDEMLSRDKERKGTLGKLSAAVRLDDPPNVGSWKEFRKGTYTYPISFAIPSSTPPTVHCDFGTIVYRLKAVVHRPGALTTRLAISTEVTLVACPADDGTEDTHSIVVERQWDAQLRYLISLSGRSFPIGSQVPFNLTMVPMDKCKVYRLSVFLEEKTEYFGRHKNATREQPVKRFELLSIRHTDKNSPPILPLNPESSALLMPYIDTTSVPASPDEALSSLMGPGPWMLSHELQIPKECGRIRFTYKHKGAQIAVHHVLKIVFRVERGDDACVDPKTGKRRLFDIVVQTPIHILSCHCNPEQIALPRYSLFGGSSFDGAPVRSCACSGWSAPLPVTGTRTFGSPGTTPANSRPSTADATAQIDVDVAERANNSYQFARLVAGQESVRGEAPPKYVEVLAQGQ